MKFSRFFPVIASLALAATPASATTIFFDTFTDGVRTNGADAQDVAWFESNTAVTSSVVATGLPGNNLAVDPANTFRGMSAAFSLITLNLGETLTVTLDLRLNSATTIANGIRIGFGNSAGNPYTADGSPAEGSAGALSHFGYFIGVGTGTSEVVSLQQDAGADSTSGFTNGSGISAIGTSSTAQGFDNGVSQSMLFSITRTSATEVSLTGKVFGATGSTGSPVTEVLNQVDSVSPYFSFNQLSVMVGANNAIDYNMDNVLVTVIPEPGAALLGGLGMLTLLRRRRA